MSFTCNRRLHHGLTLCTITFQNPPKDERFCIRNFPSTCPDRVNLQLKVKPILGNVLFFLPSLAQMTVSYLFIVMRARWISASVTMLFVVSVVMGFTLLSPKRYTAEAVVLLDVKSPDRIAGMVLPGMESSTYMLTQVGVIQSDRVVERAVKDLQLAQDPALRDQWRAATEGRGDVTTWLVSVLMPSLQVRPTRDANLISIGFTAKDPVLAAAMTNAIVKAYIATSVDLRVEPAREYSSFFDARAAKAREDLERAQSRLSAFQSERGIVVTDERLDTETTRLSELTSQMVALQATASESSNRQRQSALTADTMQEVLSNPLISVLTADLAREEKRLNELTSRLGDRHPSVIEIKASLAEMRSRIDKETQRVRKSLDGNNSINTARLEQLRRDIDAQRNKLLKLKTERDEAAVLQRDIQSAQQAYDTVSTRFNQTNLESQTTQTNVSVLKNATSPLGPSSPRVLLNTAAALVLGTLLGIAIALLREQVDPRLRADEAVLQRLGQPMLGQLPVWARTDIPGQARLRLTKLRLRTERPSLAD